MNGVMKCKHCGYTRIISNDLEFEDEFGNIIIYYVSCFSCGEEAQVTKQDPIIGDIIELLRR